MKFEILKSCLASIIVVALITLLIEIRQCYLIFKRSKFEAVFKFEAKFEALLIIFF
jgi:hypothetical protein